MRASTHEYTHPHIYIYNQKEQAMNIKTSNQKEKRKYIPEEKE